MPSQHSAMSKKVVAKKAIAQPASATSDKKAIATKQAAGGKSKNASPNKSSGNGDDRLQMVAVAAYYRAERRGFNGGNALEDWLAAEEEIDAMLH